jgi:multidrug resistance efflux pump
LVGLSALALCIIPYPFEIAGDCRVQPGAKREVRAEVAAPIDSVAVTEGTNVRRGQVLAQLSDRTIRRDLDVAKATLKRESEQLRQLENGSRKEEVDRARQRVTVAEVSLAHSSNALVRAQALYAKKHISDEDYEQALRQRDVDREQLELVRKELALVEAGERDERIQAQRAEVERLTFEVTHLEGNLQRTTLVAPISGRVTTLFVQGKVGEQANVGDVVAVVENHHPVLLRIGIPEEYAGMLKEGASVRAKIRSYPDRVFTGEIRSISPVVVERKEDLIKEASVEQDNKMIRNLDAPPVNIVPVLAEISNDDGALKTDMTGYAKVRVRNTTVAYAFLHPVIDFFRVQVWSWIP